MADLIAQGPRPSDRWRRVLPVEKPVTVGRSGPWATPWDDRISRQHVEVIWSGDALHVQQLPEARNPIFFKGSQFTQCEIAAGEHFVIGGTTFTVTAERVQVSLDMPDPVHEQAFSPQYLDRVQFRHAEAQIEVLTKLPDVISSSTNDAELYGRLVNLIMSGVPRAAAAALIAVREETPQGVGPTVDVLHWDRRVVTGDDFQPSDRLIREAVTKRESLLHIWKGAEEGTAFTIQQGIDWAFCTPILGDACRGWAIYVAGRFQVDPSNAGDVSDPSDLRDDLKFTELAAKTLAALRYSRLLERQRSSLSQFFSPIVLEAIANEDPELVLAPREADVTVIFCDLRGFSRHSEKSADDLYGLLNRVSAALGVTTHAIRERGGVLGDFHGDAAMGFWGWPLAQTDGALRACQTALAIREEFAAASARPDNPFADFSLGIGIATGKAVAGKIGTTDQVKVTVFGPVVNLASRLEGMTKILGASILLDRTTTNQVRKLDRATEFRLRNVAQVRPYGMDRSVEITELLPVGEEQQFPGDADVAKFEFALLEFNAGRWHEALELLRQFPETDGVATFLRQYIVSQAETPPDDWDGVIPLQSKSI
jgi:adenylate cyclase